MKKTIKSILALSTLMILASCGGDNKSSTSGSKNVNWTGQSVSPQNTPSSINSLYNQLSSALPCKTGQRLSTIQQFSIQGGQNSYYNSQNRLSGNFNTGTISGTTGQLYMGVSTFNDIMIISEMTNGNSVVGHNVYLSMCASQNLIIEGRTLSAFQAPNGIVLDKNTSCPYGVVDAAINTYLQADSYQTQYGTLNPAAVWTTFYEVVCN